jgi:hypothetical protein
LAAAGFAASAADRCSSGSALVRHDAASRRSGGAATAIAGYASGSSRSSSLAFIIATAGHEQA